ncbi:MAG: ABC transporter ATP-binding protein [Planctomycetales bacterium]|nr:ABC transporter ATP-binding protein [Planctomycetales bacterium]
MIEMRSVTKLYGTVIGVNDVSLRIGRGAYGLLGPNGSGKTTLLNLLIGQLRPTIGEVLALGESPWQSHTLYRRLGICPAADILYHSVTARDWVTHLTRLHDIPAAEAGRMAEDALVRVGLKDAMDRQLGSYSKGMKQRAKLAQALAHQPQILALDEPFNGLDPIGRHEMAELLRAWPAEHDGCLLLASHILHEVEAISPSFLLIRGGRLLASGQAAEIQSLLSEFPDEMLIRTSRPREVATMLVGRGVVDSLRVDTDEGTVRFATRQGLDVYRNIAGWLTEEQLPVTELSSATDSLQSLFNALMRMHRGEVMR